MKHSHACSSSAYVMLISRRLVLLVPNAIRRNYFQAPAYLLVYESVCSVHRAGLVHRIAPYFLLSQSSNNSDSGYILKFKILVPYQRSMINLANETFFSTIGYIGEFFFIYAVISMRLLPFVRLQAITAGSSPPATSGPSFNPQLVILHLPNTSICFLIFYLLCTSPVCYSQVCV